MASARLYTDAGYDSAENRQLCLPGRGHPPRLSAKSLRRTGPGIGTTCCVVEHANAWLLANKRLDRRNNKLTIIIDALPTAACIFLGAKRVRCPEYLVLIYILLFF